MLTFDERLKLLRNSFLGNAPLSLLGEATKAATEHCFERGEFIYAKSDPSLDFYVLAEGRVSHPEVPAEERQAAHRITAPGQVFGFAATVPGQPARVASARCELATAVLAINGKWFRELCSRYFAEGEDLLRRLEQEHAVYERSI